ncbi:hypothetical protein QTP70_030345 [Hemibagrus guttatus]|uniref:ribonuclease H n=1 Tax=Hemibagrus guttatus TaxID=175788 RepID=A0AAE0UMT3_9TELE|nr:hypothetical protein QTP70_030345 [Hemibagrus guttatus]
MWFIVGCFTAFRGMTLGGNDRGVVHKAVFQRRLDDEIGVYTQTLRTNDCDLVDDIGKKHFIAFLHGNEDPIHHSAMEFPDLGEHCSEKSCKRLDFLPMRCDACEGIFCKDHIIYASHNCTSSYKKVGCELEEKERFWSELDEVMESIPTGERVVIGADFNGHVGEGNTGDEEVMGKFGVKERNLEGPMVVDFAKRMDMAVVNTYFQKREEHRVLGVSSGRRKEDKETWWWNEEVQDSVQRKRLGKKKWDMDRTEENRQEYKELQRRVKKEVQKAYDELYTRLDTREGEKYRLARQRDRDGKDVQQVRVIKDRDGRVLTSEESVQRRWKEYFEELMNEENEREKRVEGVNSVEQKVDKIRKDEVRKALKRMKSGKAVGPDDIPLEVWKCLGEAAVEFLTSLFNRVLESERMPEEWRRSVLVPIFKNKGDVQSCSNYRGIKLMSHTMKLWERVVEARLRKVVEICEQQYGFMARKSTIDAILALRILMEKYRDGQRELHCVFVDLEKAYDRVPREELWYCMRKSGVAEKYVRVVQDMYERSRTVVRCAVGQTEEFKVEVGLHQGSALSPFLFAIVMDQLSEEVRQESPWTMMFAADIVICSESREQVEESLERWRFALERRGMKVSRSKTEYMCVNEREGSGTVRLQGEEVKKVQEFKYLGSTVHSNGECGKEDVQVPVCPLCNTPIPIKRGEMPDIKVGEHIDRDCKSDPAQRKRKIFTNKCSKGGCKQKEMIRVTCDQCHLNYCLKHRHPLDHDCKTDGKPVSKSGHAALMRAQGASSSNAAGSSVKGTWTGAGRPTRAQNSSAQRNSAPSVVPPVAQNVIPSSASYQAGLTEEQALQRALEMSLAETSRQTPATLSPQEQEDLALAQALAASEEEYQRQQQRQQERDSKQSNCSLS